MRKRTPRKDSTARTASASQPPSPAPNRAIDLRSFFPAGILFVLLMTIYTATACRTVGPGDSGEYAVVFSTWGVAHAPGYPLMSLLGNLVSHALPFGEPAFVLNLLNALFAALACATLAIAVTIATGNRWAGLAAGLALGTSRVFWLHAVALEVFSLNAWMAALLLLLVARVTAEPADIVDRRWIVPATALVMSTAVTHHMTLILLALPALVVLLSLLLRAKRRGSSPAPIGRTLARSALFGVLGLLLLLYLPIAAHFDPPMNWGDARDTASLMHLLGRRDFGSGVLMSPAIVATQVLSNGEAASPLGQRNFIALWMDLPRSFGPILPLFVLLGLMWTARRSRGLFGLVLGFLALLAFFFARANTPMLPLYLGVVERFYILPHVVLAFLAGCGVAQVAEWIRRPWARLVAGALAIVTCGLPMLVLDWPRVDARSNTFTRDFGANVLAGMPERAIFFSTGDLFRNGVLYQQACLGHRRDVTLVDLDLLPTEWYVRQLRRRDAVRLPARMTRMDAGDPSTLSRALLDRNLEGAASRPVTVVKFTDDTYRTDYRLVPMSIWSRIARTDRLVALDSLATGSAECIRGWAPRSIEHDYPEGSWEKRERAFYLYALGQLQAMKDLAEVQTPDVARRIDLPLLTRADSWPQELRADLFAYRADFLRSAITDSLFADRIDPAVWTPRAGALAESSLAFDAKNVQALQTVAALIDPTDARAEAGVRRRIVEIRPGDLAELVPYFKAVRRTADPALLRDASVVHARLIRVLTIASRLYPALAGLAAHWSQPLERIPELQ